MELPHLLNNLRKEEETPKYLAVEIASDSVRTATWEIAGNSAQILQTGSRELVDTVNPKELLKALDISLAQALEGFKKEPDKMVLSLPDSWLNNTEIAPDKKQLLRYVAQKLDLKPVGFVITIEAVVHFLETKRGHPPTAIVLGITSEEVAVSVVQSGRILATHSVGRSDDIGSDVEEGIARFGDIKTLPPNIVIYDGATDLEKLQQDLIEYDWQSRLPFMHIPKVDRLTQREVIEAIVFTAGKEVIATYHAEEDTEAVDSAELPAEDTQAGVPDKQEEFGFTVSHPDLGNEEITAETETVDETVELTEADDNVRPAEIPLNQEEFDDDEDFVPASTSKGKFSLKFPSLGFLKRKSSNQHAIPPVNRGRRLVILASLLVLIAGLIFAGAIFAYWYLPKAIITLYVQPQTISRQLTFTIDTSLKELDLATDRIPGVPINTEITANAQVPATGEKLVGERAQGAVTLYNRTDSVKTFEAGTRLTTDSGLIYTIDEGVTLASASSKENPDLSITTEPATAEVAITASAIGSEYNAGQDTEFQIANFGKSSFVARASKALSGGTSRQITAVAASDIAQLREEVNKEIEAKVIAQVDQTQQGFTGAVVLSNDSEEIQEDFSASTGDEATTVSLESKVMVRSVTYKKSDLSALIQNKVVNEIPENFQINPEDVTIEQQTIDEESETLVSITAIAKVLVSPNIIPLDVASKVRGKFPSVTEDYFMSQPGFKRVEIDIKPTLPEAIQTFPRIQENIVVEIELVKD